jgi:two-component system cell cycle response regulator DivK
MKLFRDVLGEGRHARGDQRRGSRGLALEHAPELVLMDIRLPDVDGVEALRRLRSDERTSSIPVLALTAQAMRGDRERFLAAGFDGYVPKPVDIAELVRLVSEHCKRNTS